MKKTKSIVSVLAALTVIGQISLSASAAGASMDGKYRLTVQPDSYAMTADEAANGTGTTGVSVYIKGSAREDLVVSSSVMGLKSDQSIYMGSMVNPTIQGDEKEYTVLGKTFTTAYTPFCFGRLNNGKYDDNTYMFECRDLCVNPVSGSVLTYMGNDTISFKLAGRYYVNEAGELAQDKVTHEIVLPLTVQEDGSATYTFKYADIYTDHVEVAEITGVIPYYQPELLKEGDSIPDSNDRISWMANIDAATSFLGNSTDFPFMQAMAKIKAGTGCGIYKIDFDSEDTRVGISGSDSKAPSLSFDIDYQGAAIAVGVESAALTDDTANIVPDYACYYAHDGRTITGASAGGKFTCDVAYTDGKSETTDVTGAVNAGVSPSVLYYDYESIAAENKPYIIQDVNLLCGNTEIEAGGAPLTMKALVGEKGDANLDGEVNLADATAVLKYYAQKAAGMTPEIGIDGDDASKTLAFFLADTDTESQTGEEGGVLNIADATNILKYYANKATGMNLAWDSFLK